MNAIIGAGAAIAACAAGTLGFRAYAIGKTRARLRECMLERHLPERESRQMRWSMMAILEEFTRRLYVGSSSCLLTRPTGKGTPESRPRKFFALHAKSAGCAGRVSASAFCELRNRLTIGGLAVGALAGSLFSTELGILLAVGLCLVARTAPDRAILDAQARRAHEAERCLSEMLEVVSLGLRSGLTFDRSFELYGTHFSSDFARSCARTHRRWALGLATREEALHGLAESYDCDQLNRIIESVIRGLRLGTSLTGSLEEAAAQSRSAHRAAVEERVAKAPVKMMIPTGTLILPAMLMLVMGPILLELAGGF